MTDLAPERLAELNALREAAALEAFEPRPLDQPWPAQTAYAKALYDNGAALLDALNTTQPAASGEDG